MAGGAMPAAKDDSVFVSTTGTVGACQASL